MRYTIQQGTGANILFAGGTTGEWNRLDNPQRQIVAQIVVDECRQAAGGDTRVEAWVGITAHDTAATLANLEHAIGIGADAVVIAPLSIKDAKSPVNFVESAIGGVFARGGRTVPVFL